MAVYEHIEERIFKPDREDVKSFLQFDGVLRNISYAICMVALVSSILTLFIDDKNIDYLARTTIGITFFLLAGILVGRNRNFRGSENITQNEPGEEYLLNLGNEAKVLKGNAYKTSKVASNLLRPLLLNSEQLKRHMLIMATIGAGKTVFMKGMIEQQAILGGGGLAVDGKGTAEFAKEVFGIFESIGRADDFIHINFLDMDNTHTINPLLVGSALAIYEILIALLIGEENEWKEKNKSFMKNILKLLIYRRDVENLKVDFTTLSTYLTLDKLVDEALNYRELAYQYTAIQDFIMYVSVAIGFSYDKFLTASEEEVRERFKAAQTSGEQGIYDAGNSAQAWREIIVNLSSDYGKVFNSQNPTISLFEAVQKNKFIFVTLPTMASDTTPKELGRLILGLLKGVAAEKAEKSVEPKIPFLCWFDEIGSYIVEGFGRLMSKSRSLGIGIIAIFQSPSQIDQVGKTVGSESLERREIIDVTGTHILMKNIHPETTKFYADMLDEKRTLDKSFSERRLGAKGELNAEASFNIEKEQAIKHKEVIGMNNGEMMVFSDGKMYRACAVTERFMNKGKKITYEGKNMDIKIPLTQYVPKEHFLRDMTKIYNQLKKEGEAA
jgi:intracellular multiplication protein IcmO